MRINETPPLIVTRPEPASSITGVSAGTSVGAQGSPATQTVPVREQAPPQPPPQLEAAERRAYVRRAEERRKLQVRVLMDTRVSQRRTARRRAEDDAPASIDTEA